LRSNRFLYDVSIVPIAYRDGVVDIEVRTRDTWTLEPGVSASRSGGTNRRGITLRDTNALGTGVFAGVSRSSDAERTSTEYRVSQPHALDGWTTLDYSLTQLSDGLNRSASVSHPFYALDTRWAAGFSASRDNRINSLFTNGSLASQYRRWEDTAEAFGGRSAGLVNGWTQRYSLGMTYVKDTYDLDPGLPPPAELPTDQTLVAPFFRYEAVEDQFEQVKNRDLIQRPEYFAMGFQSRLQLGRSLTGLGSTQSLWLYSSSAGDGIRLPGGQTVLASASIGGQSGYLPLDRQTLGSSIRFYGNPKGDTLLFSTLSGEALRDPTGSSQLVLGGDTGLRGYPRNYQSGDRKVLFSIEQRVYTDWYPFRLFRVGGAVFYDHGRAWGGPTQSTANSGWLSDVGFGLRILSARSAFGNVLHIDLAFPLMNRDPGIKRVQFLVQTKVTL
jgi:outer membrane protein assembly factor BamA